MREEFEKSQISVFNFFDQPGQLIEKVEMSKVTRESHNNRFEIIAFESRKEMSNIKIVNEI